MAVLLKTACLKKNIRLGDKILLQQTRKVLKNVKNQYFNLIRMGISYVNGRL